MQIVLMRKKKSFFFLSDTNEDSGPLEFIPNTHKTFFLGYEKLLNQVSFSITSIYFLKEEMCANTSPSLITKFNLCLTRDTMQNQ